MLNLYDYITKNRLFKKLEVNDLLFVEYKCMIEELRTGYWTHHNYFAYVLGGKKKWQTNDKEFIVADGEAIFIRKGSYVAHKYINEDFCALLIFVSDDFIKSVLTKFPLPVPARQLAVNEIDPILPVTMDNTLTMYFNSLLSYFPKSETPPKELLKIKFEELILTLLTSPSNQDIASYFRVVSENSRVSIPAIMEANFMRTLSLQEFARLCARSLSVFKSEFQDIYQTSPGKWLIKRRLEYARYLVETTDKSVLDIAFEAGFKNTSHFIRVFKEAFGQSPLKYRIVDSLTDELQKPF